MTNGVTNSSTPIGPPSGGPIQEPITLTDEQLNHMLNNPDTTLERLLNLLDNPRYDLTAGQEQAIQAAINEKIADLEGGIPPVE